MQRLAGDAVVELLVEQINLLLSAVQCEVGLSPPEPVDARWTFAEKLLSSAIAMVPAHSNRKRVSTSAASPFLR